MAKTAEVRHETSRASHIHALLKLRDKAEAEIATLLREELDTVGEAKWLDWCEREFGWKRRAAYNHLNPGLLEADRERMQEKRLCADRLHIEDTKAESHNGIDKPKPVQAGSIAFLSPGPCHWPKDMMRDIVLAFEREIDETLIPAIKANEIDKDDVVREANRFIEVLKQFIKNMEVL